MGTHETVFFGTEQAGQLTVSVVPEPGSWALLAAGLAGLGALARRKRAQQAWPRRPRALNGPAPRRRFPFVGPCACPHRTVRRPLTAARTPPQSPARRQCTWSPARSARRCDAARTPPWWR
ncbi:MAG: PEP-CTERM sorting domain-containing protein [Burkholderiales bacterium]|nr:PEP-CTERM sorting domain-containing protein [Burkholderiales bacterium]